MEHKKAHEPLLRMAKRGTALPGWKAWGIRLIGYLLSLVARPQPPVYRKV